MLSVLVRRRVRTGAAALALTALAVPAVLPHASPARLRGTRTDAVTTPLAHGAPPMLGSPVTAALPPPAPPTATPSATPTATPAPRRTTTAAPARSSSAPAPRPSYSRAAVVADITAAARTHGVSAAWLISTAECESGLRPYAYNPAGPYEGVFQFLPSTFRAHGGTDIWDPVQQAQIAAAMFAGGDSVAWPVCSRR